MAVTLSATCLLNKSFCPPLNGGVQRARYMRTKRVYSSSYRVRAFFDLSEEPIVKEALKEPMAFLGGVFAGILRLDVNDEPLKEWVEKTAEAAGVEPEYSEQGEVKQGPEEIQIE